MNSSQLPVVEPLADLASEVVRVMNDEQLGPDNVPLATSIVMANRKEGFGRATEVMNLVKAYLVRNPDVSRHLEGNKRHRSFVSRNDAFAEWQQRQEFAQAS